jgi:hypothetical protein
MNIKKSLTVVPWDGVTQALPAVEFDTTPAFDLLLYNYSGNDAIPSGVAYQYLLTGKTECKGQIMSAVYHFLKDNNTPDYEYIGVIDDDILFRISDINYMLRIAGIHQLDTFQPSLYKDSYHSHRHFVHQPDIAVEMVRWVEIMAPFYRKALYDAAHAYYPRSISGYGVDCYVMPYYQKLMSMERSAIIHAVSIKHYRPVTAGATRRFSNGLTSKQEGELLREEILGLIQTQGSKAFDKEFLAEVYGVGKGATWYAGKTLRMMQKLVMHTISKIKKRY